MEALESPLPVPFPSFNISTISICDGDLQRNGCLFSEAELPKRDAIATVRIVVSCLSIIGSLSIIVSVLWRKVIRSPKVHPIFVISVADCVLGFSWVLGGAFWFGQVEDRSWCFLPSILTVIMQCVSVNLTVVYALIAYGLIKRQDFSSVLLSINSHTAPWKTWKIATAYVLAWSVPTVLILFAFGIVASLDGIVHNANDCTCWCLPIFANIIPMSFQADWASAVYMFHIRKVLLAFAVMLLTTYLLGFLLLVFMYHKILSHIRRVKKSHAKSPSSPASYGAIGMMLMRGHSQAKKRVVYFLSAFIITGFANAVLSAAFTYLEAKNVARNTRVKMFPLDGVPLDHMDSWFKTLIITAQSLTAPLQGFLNALVYGWTREDFVHSGGRRRAREGRRESLVDSLTSEEDELTSSGPVPDDSGYCDHRLTDGRGASGRPRSQSGGLLGERGERGEKGERGVGEKGAGRRWVTTSGAGQRGRQAAANIHDYTTGIM